MTQTASAADRPPQGSAGCRARCRPRSSTTARVTTASSGARCRSPGSRRGARAGAGRGHLRQRPQVLPRGSKFWGDADTGPRGPRPRSSPGTSSSARSSQLDAAAALRWGVARSATASWPSRSCRAGSAATAGAGSTGCARRTTSSASSGPPRAPWRPTWSSRRGRWCTGSPPRCLPAHAAFAEPLSCALHAVERGRHHASTTWSSWPAAARSASAWSPAPAPRTPRTWSRWTCQRRTSSSWPAAAARTWLSTSHARTRSAVVRGPDRGLRRRRLPRGQRPPVRRAAGPDAAAQARDLRRVRRLRLRRHRRLVDHQRRQGAGRPRRPPRAALLAGRRSGCSSPACCRMDDIVTHQLPLADFQTGLDLVADGSSSIKVDPPAGADLPAPPVRPARASVRTEHGGTT